MGFEGSEGGGLRVPGVKGRSGGRNRKSVEQHILDGTFQASRHAGRLDVILPAEDPRVPRGFKGEALAEWRRMVERLRATKVLTAVDDGVLARYCLLHARAVRLEHALQTSKPFGRRVTVDGSGVEYVEEKVHPGFAQLRQYDLALRAYLVEFGLTPAARARVSPKDDGEGEKADPFDEFEGLHAVKGGRG